MVSALSLITLQGSSFSAMLSLFDARVCTTLNSSAIHTTPASLGVSGVLLPRHDSFFFRSSSARATFTLPAWKGTNPGLALHNTTSSMFALKQINNPLPHFCRTNTSQEGLKVQPFCRKALKILLQKHSWAGDGITITWQGCKPFLAPEKNPPGLHKSNYTESILAKGLEDAHPLICCAAWSPSQARVLH